MSYALLVHDYIPRRNAIVLKLLGFEVFHGPRQLHNDGAGLQF